MSSFKAGQPLILRGEVRDGGAEMEKDTTVEQEQLISIFLLSSPKLKLLAFLQFCVGDLPITNILHGWASRRVTQCFVYFIFTLGRHGSSLSGALGQTADPGGVGLPNLI